MADSFVADSSTPPATERYPRRPAPLNFPSMLALIEHHRDAIARLCRRHGVGSLDLFGSAVRDDFDPATSDVDFMVLFQAYDSPHIADQWFALQEDLEALLGAPVQLTSRRAADNPYFLRVAERDRVTLYAA